MPHHMQPYIDRIEAWANARDDIRAAIIVGSIARPGDDTTRFSDLDIELYITDTQPYLDDEAWLSEIGDVWVCLPLWNDGVYPTRLTWYAEGRKIDFKLVPANVLDQQVAEGDFATDEMYRRGYRVLIDKDGRMANVPRQEFGTPQNAPPTAEAFEFCVRQFWFETMHVVQYIAQRDLWVAAFRDTLVKEPLLEMLQWYAEAHHIGDDVVKHTGKALHKWVDAPTWEAVQGVWARYDAEDSWDAVFTSNRLFSRLAQRVAEAHGFAYDIDRDTNIQAYCQRLFDEDDVSG